MKTIGIVVEYNPFHNGHIYQIKKIKEMYKDSCIIVVMSPTFTMRGEISLMNKWQKTIAALNYGVDLVIELPTIFSTQSADTFAKYAIMLLNEVKIDTLVFGSESDDVALLKEVASVQLNNPLLDEIVRDNLNKGCNYPTALSRAIEELTNIKISKPNDILAVTYLKEVLNQNAKIDVVSIKRTNEYSDVFSDEEIVSASNIRHKYLNNISFKKSVPIETYEFLKNNNIDNALLFNLIKYKIISEKDNLSTYHLVDEGIEARLYKGARLSNSLDELLNYVKTKRYTNNRIMRTFIQILLGVKKTDEKSLEYIRVLGMSKVGQMHLKRIKKRTSLEVITKYKKEYPSFKYEVLATEIYSIISHNNSLIKEEYTHAVIKND